MLRNRTLLAVSFAVCASFTGIGMVVPVRVLYAESRGASLAIIGAMASSYLISNFLFQYPSGWIADRWGRKPIMIVSLFLQAVVSATYLLIADPILFVLVRFIEGAVAAAFLPSARALITDAIPLKHRGEAFGIFSASMTVAGVAVLATASLGITGMLPASIYAAAPRFAPQPALLALTVGIVVQASHFGHVVGPSMLGAWVERLGWSSSPALFAAIGCGGLAVALGIRRLTRTHA